METVQPLLDVIQSFGVAGLLLYLWLQERKRAETWQERYIHMLERLIDLRSVARTPD